MYPCFKNHKKETEKKGYRGQKEKYRVLCEEKRQEINEYNSHQSQLEMAILCARVTSSLTFIIIPARYTSTYLLSKA